MDGSLGGHAHPWQLRAGQRQPETRTGLSRASRTIPAIQTRGDQLSELRNTRSNTDPTNTSDHGRSDASHPFLPASPQDTATRRSGSPDSMPMASIHPEALVPGPRRQDTSGTVSTMRISPDLPRETPSRTVSIAPCHSMQSRISSIVEEGSYDVTPTPTWESEGISPIAPQSRSNLPFTSVDTSYDSLLRGPESEPFSASAAPRLPSALSRSATMLKSARSAMSRLGSTRSASPGGSRNLLMGSFTPYHTIGEEGSHPAAPKAKRMSARYETLPENDASESQESYGIDLSSMGGSFGMQILSGGTADDSAATSDQSLPSKHGDSLVIKQHQLESEGILTGGLGRGMSGRTINLPKTLHEPSPVSAGTRLPRFTSVSHKLKRADTVRDVGQRAANERKEMVIIRDPGPSVDLSTLDAHNDYGSKAQAKPSYFFPEDPDKPNWRPFPMQWPYITVLTIISLATAGIQEYLCQLSLRRTAENDGLLKFRVSSELSTWSYFCWRYLPTIIAVTYGVMWQAVDFEVKRLEPYYQLSKSGGALAIESINLDYLTCWKVAAPFKAFKRRQWAVLNCSIANLTAGLLVATLQNASVNLEPKADERSPDKDKYVRMDPVWSRLLTASLTLVAISGGLLLFQLRRKSGLLSDPKGVAGIAAMANRSHILVDFKDLDTANEKELHAKLKHRRYILHKSTLWQGEFVRSDNSKDQEARKPESEHPFMLHLVTGVLFIGFMLAVLAFIPVLVFSNKVYISDSNSWVLTAIATVIKFIWNSLECDVRVIQPFYLLSRRNAPSETLTLDYSGTIPGWMPVKAFMQRHYIVCLMGVGAIMVEVLTVCMSSFSAKSLRDSLGGGGGSSRIDDHAGNGQETPKSFWASFFLSMFILSFLCCAAAVVYARRHRAFLPRQPSTIASVLAYMHQSNMLTDFVETELYNESKMEKHLKDKGYKYGLGIIRGRDGEKHCGIDREPLLSDYTRGSMFKKATAPWSDWWDPNIG
ncbi:MAG: hypothetical protein M1825_004063 [Sarcosagium campestre]|nr:MAG: hypothetical protein M1825_004063 [Sarcosagium campestre]